REKTQEASEVHCRNMDRNNNYYNNKFTVSRPRVYHKMNSSRWGTREYRNNSENTEKQLTGMLQKMNIEKYSFPTKIGDQEGPTIQIEKLENFDLQDVNKWIEKFQSIQKLANLGEEGAREYLTFLTDEKFHPFLEEGNTVQEKLKRLKESVYNQSLLQRTMRKLDNLHVGKFESIKGYNEEIQKTVKTINLCLKKSENLTKREVEEKFIKGLSGWMREEMNRLAHLEFDKRINAIELMEASRNKNREE
ncbi:putative transposable element, partial [Pseudoloma neurophilia]